MSDWHEIGSVILPLSAERVTINKRSVDRTQVTIKLRVHEEPVTVREDTEFVGFSVERKPVNQVVEHAPAVRQEGDTTIYPIVEEELVIVKRLVLREELRVTRVVTTAQEERDITLRSVKAEVTRTPVETASAPRPDVP